MAERLLLEAPFRETNNVVDFALEAIGRGVGRRHATQATEDQL